MNRLVLLDRDGTIIAEKHYLSSPEQVELIPGAAAGIRALRRLGLPVVVVTNQSGVGRGLFGLDDLDRVHRRLVELLAAEEAAVDGFYVCPHTPADACGCRKPAPGLARQAAAAFGADLGAAFVVGDKPCDVDLGRAVGARTVLVRTGYGRQVALDGAATPDHVADDLADAAGWIERIVRAPEQTP